MPIAENKLLFSYNVRGNPSNKASRRSTNENAEAMFRVNEYVRNSYSLSPCDLALEIVGVSRKNARFS